MNIMKKDRSLTSQLLISRSGPMHDLTSSQPRWRRLKFYGLWRGVNWSPWEPVHQSTRCHVSEFFNIIQFFLLSLEDVIILSLQYAGDTLTHLQKYLFGQYIVSEQDRTCTYNVTLWRVGVTIVAMEAQKLVSFVLITYICRCQQCHTESVAIENQQYVVFIVALHTSLPTIWNTLRSPSNLSNIFVRC
jgi:hypothetical protein